MKKLDAKTLGAVAGGCCWCPPPPPACPPPPPACPPQQSYTVTKSKKC
ncbi:hypothetical protein [Methylobacterium isbiliense]|jgi:hypothetical protein|uniref:Uncharacterized protein n=1 Tax=Methylobacterium isbiliense TaxID=315478 RepID=A0ABQ4S6J6_9HYPH|nr:hypothetical protein [Methylobacterium isbiliense]MDN3626298.1 hypothetical protein [Methylobacterium isbiliense]GJD98581.1 hypothetical protein GMJLKIPL_0492 [Methylobacterium isbiliense]